MPAGRRRWCQSDLEFEVSQASRAAPCSRTESLGVSSHASRAAPQLQAFERSTDSAESIVPKEESSNVRGHLLSRSHICKREDFKAISVGQCIASKQPCLCTLSTC